MAATTSVSTVLISTVVHNVARDFVSLEDALTAEGHFAAQVSPTAINDELSRFRMWAGNIAAHRRGRRSLEYRLRDADSLKRGVHDVLKDLATALHNSLEIVKGERTPWDLEEFSDNDSDVPNNDLQGDTELKQLLASIATFVTSLFRLSMAIRDPAPTNQSTRTISADKSYFEPHDIFHVQAKYPDAAGYLSERLGRAISARRQYLSYREEHHQKLAKHVEKIGFEEPTTEHTSNSTEATPMPQSDRQNSANVLDEDDGASQTSFAPSFNAPIRIPPLPKEALDGEFYECPLCFVIISIHDKHAWKQHAFRDLHPYSCTFPHCTTADRLYDSRHEWFQHELEAHRMSWQCFEGCDKIFDAQHSFDDHIQKAHADLAPMLPALRRTSARGADLTEQVQCSLCTKGMSLRALQKHLASHQQQLSLFALPTNLDETEDDEDEEDRRSQGMQESDDDNISNVSDTRDADESSTPKIPWRTVEFDPPQEATENTRMDDAEEEDIMPTRDASDTFEDQNQTDKTVPVEVNRVQVRFPAYDDFAWANIERYLRQKWPSWNDFEPCRLGHDWSFQVPEQLTEADYMELRRRRDGLGRRRRPSVQSDADLDEHGSQQASETDFDNRSAYNEINRGDDGYPLTDTADMYSATETMITDRESAREPGPPPSTRGFDKINYSQYLEEVDQPVAVEDDTNRGRGETLSTEERGRSLDRGGALAAERAYRPFIATRDDQVESEQNEDEEVEAVIQPVAAPGYYIASDGRQYPLSQMPQKSEDTTRAANPDSEATGSRIWPGMHQQSAVARAQSQADETTNLNGPTKASKVNEWFVPDEGIGREVITAEIQRYLGPDALVRFGVGTGEYTGLAGYWVTAYRPLTAQMIQDLKMDSQPRQYWGPPRLYHAARF